jgi:excisionase family DNA binding protein
MTLVTYSAAEVADMLGCTVRWIQEIARRGEIEYLEGSRRSVRFTEEQLTGLVAYRTRTPQPAPPQPIGAKGRRRTASRSPAE